MSFTVSDTSSLAGKAPAVNPISNNARSRMPLIPSSPATIARTSLYRRRHLPLSRTMGVANASQRSPPHKLSISRGWVGLRGVSLADTDQPSAEGGDCILPSIGGKIIRRLFPGWQGLPRQRTRSGFASSGKRGGVIGKRCFEILANLWGESGACCRHMPQEQICRLFPRWWYPRKTAGH